VEPGGGVEVGEEAGGGFAEGPGVGGEGAGGGGRSGGSGFPQSPFLLFSSILFSSLLWGMGPLHIPMAWGWHGDGMGMTFCKVLGFGRLACGLEVVADGGGEYGVFARDVGEELRAADGKDAGEDDFGEGVAAEGSVVADLAADEVDDPYEGVALVGAEALGHGLERFMGPGGG
jgi:hypothetical protein